MEAAQMAVHPSLLLLASMIRMARGSDSFIVAQEAFRKAFFAAKKG
jgi:hypothetical protein